MLIPSMLIFLYKFNSAKMHSQKHFSRLFCKLSVPIPNEQTLGEHVIILLKDKLPSRDRSALSGSVVLFLKVYLAQMKEKASLV